MSEYGSILGSYSGFQRVVLWSDLYTARVTLTDAAMCMNLMNEFLFNIVISYVIFSHCDFLCIVQTKLHLISLTGNFRKWVV